jgi:hypothetical protein
MSQDGHLAWTLARQLYLTQSINILIVINGGEADNVIMIINSVVKSFGLFGIRIKELFKGKLIFLSRTDCHFEG